MLDGGTVIAAGFVGAGIASVIWSCIAWSETFQWMKLVDRCLDSMKKMHDEVMELRDEVNRGSH